LQRNVGNIAEAMWKVMYEAGGIGLAAPQVGLSIRLAVIDCEGFKDVLINPVIIKREGNRRCVEGCLSLPGHQFAVYRSHRVCIEYTNLAGKRLKTRAGGNVLAQCFEHETDHLNGVLIDIGRRMGAVL